MTEALPNPVNRLGSERHIEFEPFEGYSDNDSYGWEGPLIVRQRYTLRP
jgi:hypothetical protein